MLQQEVGREIYLKEKEKIRRERKGRVVRYIFAEWQTVVQEKEKGRKNTTEERRVNILDS